MDGILNDDEVEGTTDLAALHKAAMEDWKLAEEAWEENLRLALEDIKFRAGDHWPESIKAARGIKGKERPMLVVDKLNQYVRQIVNDARQNRPAVKVRPIDDEGDIEIAEAFQGIIRHICERSNADDAFDNAIECAVVGGFGYYRVTTEYAHERTFNQEICVKRIPNPLSVYLDPNAQEQDASDGRFAFVIDEMPKAEFKRRYPKAKFVDFEKDGADYAEKWADERNVRIAEYFYKVETPKTMHLLDDGTTAEDEEYQEAIAAGVEVPQIVQSREMTQTEVRWARISGAEVLETNEWEGKYIPIIRVVGNEYNVDGKVIFSGLIRAAKDPQRLYNYSRSAFAERVALTPKSPWMIAEGQIEDHEDAWANANLEPTVLVYKETSLDGHPVPPPQRVSATDIPEGFARDMQLSEHDIQASMGMYAASIGQQGNERSGKAIAARQREGDTATFHYQDNAAKAVRYLGCILVDLIPEIYDSKRVVRIMGEDGESDDATIDPKSPQPVIKMGGHSIYNLNVGTYDVSVSAGPSFTTRRVEQSEAMMELIHNSPEVMQIAGDLLIKSQDWPGADDLAERFKLMLPPPIQAAIAAEKEGIPPEAQAVIVHAQQAVQQRDMQIQEMGKAIQDAQQAVAKLELQVKDNADKVQVDMLKVEVDRFEAETKRMQAAAAMSQTPQDTFNFDQLKLQYEDKWKQLEADTKILIAEMQAKTQIHTTSMSAQPTDGATTLDEEGKTHPNPALAALIETVNENMAMLMQSHQQSQAQMLQMMNRPKVATLSNGKQVRIE